MGRRTRHLMTSLRNLSLTLFSGTALLLAQDPQAGGWRRAGDPPPPAPVERAQPQDPGVLDQDPTQPVARSDGYGQVEQQAQGQQQPQLQQRQVQRPPAAVPHYGLPPAGAITP